MAPVRRVTGGSGFEGYSQLLLSVIVLDKNNLNKEWFYWNSHIHICSMPRPYYIDFVISIRWDVSLQTFSRNSYYTTTSAHRTWMVTCWSGTTQGQARGLRTQGFFLLKLTVALSELAVLFSSLQLCFLEKFSVS